MGADVLNFKHPCANWGKPQEIPPRNSQEQNKTPEWIPMANVFPVCDHQALETLELVTQQMAAAVARCSRDLRYVWANQAYAKWIQRPPESILGQSIEDVLGTQAFESLRKHFEQVLSGSEVRFQEEVDVRGIGKRWVSAAYAPIRDSNGAVDGWVSVVLDITDRKREEEARFRHAAVIESSRDAIISKNLDGIITSWNAGAESMFGYKEEEVVGKPITILFPPELNDEEDAILRRLRSGARIEHYETKRLTKAGKLVDVSLVIGPIQDSNGRLTGFSKVARDITDRKQMEASLKESEQRFRLVADTAPVMIWMAGTDKLCTYFNKPWLNFTGRTVEQELGNGWAEGVHAEDFEQCLSTYEQSFGARRQFKMQYRLRRHDDEYRWVLDIGTPRFQPDGSFAGYIGVCVDVHDQRTAEERLRRLNRALEEQTAVLESREELLKTFVQNVPAGVAMLDREMRYLQVSDRWCADYSMDASQLGRSHYELFPDIPPHWREMHSRALAGETLRADEDCWRRKDGDMWVRWELRPWRTANGDVGGMLIFAEDITERKKMQDALSAVSGKLLEAHEQERRRISRELHDDILQRLALLSLEVGRLQADAPQLNTRLQDFQAAVLNISKDVHALSHGLHSSKIEYLGVVAGIKSWCKEFADRHKIELDFIGNLSSAPPSETGICLLRILQEAIGNAVKHGGARRIEVRLTERLGEVQMIVSDSGAGFDVEEARQGKGLGLVTMQERVRLVRGSMTISSKPAGGTVVDVRVPLISRDMAEKLAG
jgi:PAS domain S-box-containing protein